MLIRAAARGQSERWHTKWAQGPIPCIVSKLSGIDPMKIFLLVVIGFLFYTSDDARYFVSDRLDDASEIIRPAPEFKLFGFRF